MLLGAYIATGWADTQPPSTVGNDSVLFKNLIA
jgi:hypothetical protein